VVSSKFAYFEELSLKKSSRQITPALIKAGILTIERVQGAADYLE